jgi:DNA polymerase-3 subunit epsilon
MKPERAELLADLPHERGVYVLRDGGRRPLYVGTSDDVRSRVASHLGDRRDRFPGREVLAASVRSVRWVPAGSRLEALLLEARLIRRWRPHYNRALKNVERYTYLRILDERFPRLRATASIHQEEGPVYGPWRKEYRAGHVAWGLRKAFGIRGCRLDLEQRTLFDACGRKGAETCGAPCVVTNPVEDYERRVEATRAFLEGRERGEAAEVEDEEIRESLEMAFAMLERLRVAVEAPDELLRLPGVGEGRRKVLLVRAGRPIGPYPIPPREAAAARLLARLRAIPRPDPAFPLPNDVVDDVKILAAHRDAVPEADRLPVATNPDSLIG